MKALIALLGLVLALSSCGGGGGDVSIAPASTLRTDLYYGYYGSDRTSVAETLGHVNLLWESGFLGEDQAVANIDAARLPTVLDLTAYVYAGTGNDHYAHPDREIRLRTYFARLHWAGLLQYVVALYPIDEPDGTVRGSADITAVNVSVRAVAAEFAELANVKLAVIYAGAERFTNIKEFDWVGFDHYSEKSGIFANGEYQALLKAMQPGQRAIIVPPGYQGQDPTPFFNKAQTDNIIIAMIPFLWIDINGGNGIRSNADRLAYCLAGEQIKTPGRTGACANGK